MIKDNFINNMNYNNNNNNNNNNDINPNSYVVDINSGEYIESENLDSNLCSICKENLLECVFCEGLFPQNILSSHKSLCGKLRENLLIKDDKYNCSNCNKYILIVDINTHSKNCVNGKEKVLKYELKCVHCEKLFPYEFIQEHERSCSELKSQEFILNEKYKCAQCKEELYVIQKPTHDKVCEFLMNRKEEVEKKAKLLENQKIFPSNWSENIVKNEIVNENLTLAHLNPFSEEYTNITNQLSYYLHKLKTNHYQTIFGGNCSINVTNASVSNIIRIQNKDLYQQYKKKKDFIQKQNPFKQNEHSLFFVIPFSSSNYNSIRNYGVDASFCWYQPLYNNGFRVLPNLNLNEVTCKNARYFRTSFQDLIPNINLSVLSKEFIGENFVNNNNNFYNVYPYQRSIRISVFIYYCSVLTGDVWTPKIKKCHDQNKFIEHIMTLTKPPRKNNYNDFDSLSNPMKTFYAVFDKDQTYPTHEIELTLDITHGYQHFGGFGGRLPPIGIRPCFEDINKYK